jgi:type IV pilus assembly protein PilZ
MNDLRRHPRAPIELEVRYQRLNSFFADYTRNVSKGGLFVKTERALPVGTRFLFRLALPGGAGALELSGEVVHADPQGDAPGMGLRFVWDDDAARAAFEARVEALMAESLGEGAAAGLLGHPPRKGGEPA